MNLRPRLPLLSWLQFLLFLSGFSALVLEVVYVKLLRYWAGNTAYAVASVLCAYMAGLALGSHLAGRWLVRARNLLAVYAGCEFAIGLYSAALPFLMKRLEPAYLALTLRLGSETNLALVGNFLLAAAAVLFPTLLMGATYPVVVRAASRGGSDRHDAAELIYTANLAGAALGALASDFLLIRFWGMGNTLLLMAALNTTVAVWALALGRAEHAPSAPATGAPPAPSAPSSLHRFVALAGGFLVLFQEIVWTHMVGRFLDSTVYGFAVALFGVLAGLGLGALLVARRVVNRSSEPLLAWACLVAGSLAMLLSPFWDNARVLTIRHPDGAIFLALLVLTAALLPFAPYPRTLVFLGAIYPSILLFKFIYLRTNPSAAVFWIGHSVEFAVCTLFMLGPAVLMGAVFPLVLDSSLGGTKSAVAPLYVANTVGSLTGIVTATFLVVPWLGVERSGRAAALAFFVLGLVLFARRAHRPWALSLALLPALTWTVGMPLWDFSKTHAVLGQAGRLVYIGEDLNGGVTSVVELGITRHLYTNGMIQAGTDNLVPDQVRFGLLPLLHTREFDRAMVIGLGSGQTAGVVGLFPFRTIDLVDLSPGVVEAGKKFFQDVNLAIYDDPRVRVHLADGRHYLMTHEEKLSLLTIEVTRLWVAGEGDLYTRDFYQLCAARLGERGVLQQWIPIFGLRFPETMTALRTLRSVFPHVALYLGYESGMMVASRSPLVADYERLRELDRIPALEQLLARLDLPSIFSLLGDCALVPEGVDSLLAKSSEGRISTDLWPHLEHSVARQYLAGNTAAAARRFFLSAQEFRSLPIVGVDPETRSTVERWILAERGRQISTKLE